jgi:hypothetical protein
MVGYSKAFIEQIEKENADSAARRMLSMEELEGRFGFHVFSEEQKQLTLKIRHHFLTTALAMDMLLPAGRAKAIALTELETCSMWAIKSVVDEAKPKEDPS